MKNLFLALLIPISAIAQPGVCFIGGTTSGCPTLLPSPTTASYLSTMNTQMINMSSAYSQLPQPRIAVGVQMQLMSFSWFTSDLITYGCYVTPSTCTFASASKEIAYFNSIKNAATSKIVDINIYLDPFMIASECSGCATPGNVAAQTYGLSVYDSVMDAIHSAGYQIRLSFVPAVTTWTACGITGSSMTVTQMTACIGPIETGAAQHIYNREGSSFLVAATVIHEPTALWNLITGQTFSVVNWSTALATLYPLVKAVSSSIQVGSGFTAGENSYVTYAITNNVTTQDFIGVDAYPSNTPGNFTTLYTNTYANYCSEALAASKACVVNELGMQTYIPTGSVSGSESLANPGCGYPGWNTFGLSGAMLQNLFRFFSANGATYISLFPSMSLVYLGTQDNSNCNDNGTGNSFAEAVMNNLGSLSAVGAQYQASSTWGTSIQGFISFTGKVVIQ